MLREIFKLKLDVMEFMIKSKKGFMLLFGKILLEWAIAFLIISKGSYEKSFGSPNLYKLKNVINIIYYSAKSFEIVNV